MMKINEKKAFRLESTQLLFPMQMRQRIHPHSFLRHKSPAAPSTTTNESSTCPYKLSHFFFQVKLPFGTLAAREKVSPEIVPLQRSKYRAKVIGWLS